MGEEGKEVRQARRKLDRTGQRSQGKTAAAIWSEMGTTGGKSGVVNADVGAGREQGGRREEDVVTQA